MDLNKFVKENKDNKQIGLLIQRLENNRFNKGQVIEIIRRLGIKNKTQISFIMRKFDIKETLPVVIIKGRKYYADERIRQFRNVKDAHDIIMYVEYFK